MDLKNILFKADGNLNSNRLSETWFKNNQIDTLEEISKRRL